MEKTYQKKIERISQAIYLISNHLKDNEPLKWELRKESIGFLSCIRSMDETGGGDDLPADLVIDTLSTYARDLMSLVSLGVVAGLISKSNGAIINQELEGLLSLFMGAMDEHTARAGFVLSQDFFAADPELKQHLSENIYKGQLPNFLSDKSASLFNEKIPFPKDLKLKNSQSSLTQSHRATDSGNTHTTVKDKKGERQMKILGLLQNHSNLSVKDFLSVIPDCSEKTIQRELLGLVEKGILKKEGERRWSTYSLK